MSYAELSSDLLEKRHEFLIHLQRSLNSELKNCFELNKRNRKQLARVLIDAVDALISRENAKGANLVCLVYGGCDQFEFSDQLFCSQTDDGRLYMNFVGFSVQVSWVENNS